MGCFSIYQEGGRPRANNKHKLTSPPAASSLRSLKVLKGLKVGNLCAHFSSSCNSNGRNVAAARHRHVCYGFTNPYSRARAAFRSASSKLVSRHHSKALPSSSFSNVRSVCSREAQSTEGLSRHGAREEKGMIFHSSALLASAGSEATALDLFPLPLPPSEMSAAPSISEDSSLQSMSSSSSASSSLSCSSTPSSACSMPTVSQDHKVCACIANTEETNALPRIAQPLPLPPASEMASSPQEYSYDELAGACINFAQEFFIRDGGAGPVFRALVKKSPDEESGVEIAVTKLSRGHLHSPKKWKAEVGTLSRLSHPNICKVLGLSKEDPPASVEKLIIAQRERLLVYEHTSNGNLESLLYGRKGRAPPLDWDSRVKIAVGTAQGLAFLHERTPRQIIYRIFKTLNIQVDYDFSAKLSDYGFARTPQELPFETPAPLLPSDCAYAAPETRSYDEVTPKSNVWSFGIVLLELLTGRQNMDDFFAAEERNLVQWCRPYVLDPRRLYLVMDPELKGRYPTRKAKVVADLALRCLLDDPAARPSMADVAALLSPFADTRYLPNTKQEKTLLSYDLHSSDNFYIGIDSFLNSGVRSNFSKSHSLASVLASPARSFAANLRSNALYCSPACDSKVRFKGHLSGEIMKEWSYLLPGCRGEHPFIAQSSYMSEEVTASADESHSNRLLPYANNEDHATYPQAAKNIH